MALAEVVAQPATPASIRLFIDHCGQHEGVKRPHTARRNFARIMWDLIDNGPAEDERSGAATGLLYDRMAGKMERGRTPATSNRNHARNFFSGMMKDLDHAGMVTRLLSGKRCYLIAAAIDGALMERAGYPRSYCGAERRAQPEPLTIVTPEPESEPQPALTVVPSVHPESDDDIKLDAMLTELAVPTASGMRPVALLMEAVRLISLAVCELPAGRAAVDTEVAERLASTLEDNQRMRRKLSLVGDELAAVKTEREGLRRAKQMLEANMSNMAKGAFNEQDYRRFIELDKIVRTAPGPIDKG